MTRQAGSDATSPGVAPDVESPSTAVVDRDTVVILDFGAQYAQLIARRVREANVYSELLPHDVTWDSIAHLQPRGVILSGGPASVYEDGAPELPDWVISSGLPVLGICYGMQLLTHHLGGRVGRAEEREYGPAAIDVLRNESIFSGLPDQLDVWMSHGDRIESLPPDFEVLASTDNAPFAAMRRGTIVGIQFHPEVSHTPLGSAILRSFLYEVCGCTGNWTPDSFIESTIEQIRNDVGNDHVLLALSGGVDSSVAAALIHRAIGKQLTPVFVNTGLLREGEAELVRSTFAQSFGMNLVYVDATERFLERLSGLADPEEKRKAIGAEFIRVFEHSAREHGPFKYLAQGTLYPDVIESATQSTSATQKIKTHHNVGGLPEDLDFELLEPLRFLFKDEVREIGKRLGLPDEIIQRQPFPGPGLAVRILGAVNDDDLALLRRADAIVRQEIEGAGLSQSIWQFFAVLLPVYTTGVMGDGRTYAKVCAIRAITSEDAMTADWARLPDELLSRMSNRIVNEIDGINRVVYDITSKPPATIEWE